MPCSAFRLEMAVETPDNFTVWAANKRRPLYSFRMSERKTVEDLVNALNAHMQNVKNAGSEPAE